MNPSANKTALIVVDMQNDFISGSLAVANAEQIIAPINDFAKQFDCVILTQDYHPKNHISFADAHQKSVAEQIDTPYGKQILWPSHCVQGSFGVAFDDRLSIEHARLIIRKGGRESVDSYSAFLEADGTPTGLDGYLKQLGIDTVYIVGIAFDFCVSWTAVDAAKLGYQVVVVRDATAAIDYQGSLADAYQKMQNAGVSVLTMAECQSL